MAIQARARATFHRVKNGQSSYTHIRYSADGKTFTPASAAALEQAKNWPIEGRNIFILNGATLRYDTRGVVNQVHSLGRLSRVIRKHKDKRLIRVSANVTFRGCTLKSGNLCLLQMNGTTYGWNATNVYSPGHGSNQTYRVSRVIEVSYGADHDDAGLNIRIDHISGGEVEVTNLQLEFVESVSDPGTPYKPSPEDAAIGTTPGRYRGEVVTDSPIAPIDFKAYTWVDTKGEKGDQGDRGEQGAPNNYNLWIGTGDYTAETGNTLPFLPEIRWNLLREIIGKEVTISFEARAKEGAAYDPVSFIHMDYCSSTSSTNRSWVRDFLWNKPKELGANWERFFFSMTINDDLSFEFRLNGGEAQTLRPRSSGGGDPTFTSFSGHASHQPYIRFGQWKGFQFEIRHVKMEYGDVATPWNRAEIEYRGDKGDRGERGEKGDNGRSVKAIKTQYYLSTSKAVQQGGAWQDAPPSWQKGKYLWTRLHTSFSDGSSTTTAPVVDSGWEIQGQLQIGGTNLFGFRRGLQYWGLHTVIAPNSGIKGVAVKISAALQNGVLCRIQKLGFGRPGTYTVSGLIKATKNVRLQLDICDAGHTMVDVTTVLKPFQLTANVTMYWQADNYNGFFDIEAPTGNNLQPGNVIEVHNLMIERGNIASDYRQAEEDATYMQRILEENLRIEKVNIGSGDGVYFSGRFEAREFKNGKDITRSFLNGDTAGTRPAFAAGVENFGMPTESYATALYHDGSGHIGQMSFTPDGQMYVGRNGIHNSRVRISGHQMPNLSTLHQQNTASVTMPQHTVTATDSNTGSNGDDRITAEAIGGHQIAIPSDLGELSIKGKIKLYIKRHPNTSPQFYPYVDAYVLLKGKKESPKRIGYVLLHSNGIETTQEFVINETLVNLPKDTYQIQIGLGAFGAQMIRGEFIMTAPGQFTGQMTNPMTSVHTDGLISYFRPNQFVAIQDGKFTAKGDMDIPGVLLAGRVKADGSPKVYWGSRARKAGIKTQRLQWVGTYRVFHTIGHENYAPVVTGIGDSLHIFGQLTTIAADFFDVCIKNVSGTFVNGEFSFSVFGMN